MYNFEITLREVVISLTILIACLTGLMMGTFAIKDSYVGRNDMYDTADVYSTQEYFDFGLAGGTGRAFIYADIVAGNLVSFPELKEDFVYVKRVKQTWDLVTKTRTVTYQCGKNTCTRIETYTEWEWVTHDRVTIHSDTLLINGYEVDYDDVSGIHDHDLELELNMFETSTIGGKEIYEITGWSNDYIEVGNSGIFNSNDTRYYYQVIRPSDIVNGSMFVNFKDRIMTPGETSSFRFYEMNEEELLVHMHKSPVGWYIFMWTFGIIITSGLIFGFYYLDNAWLNKKKERDYRSY